MEVYIVVSRNLMTKESIIQSVFMNLQEAEICKMICDKKMSCHFETEIETHTVI